MPRRSILTARQRAALFDLPTDEATILYHYTLADDDLEFIRTRGHYIKVSFLSGPCERTENLCSVLYLVFPKWPEAI